jgi:hypothetical protein
MTRPPATRLHPRDEEPDEPHRREDILLGRIAELPPLTGSYTRVALTQKLRRIVDESVGYGLVLEGISAADVARSQVREKDPQRQPSRSG